MNSPDRSDEIEDFVESAQRYWESNGARMTVVRRILCETIAEQSEAFNAEGLLALSQKRDPMISLSSVYRTLKPLEEAGLLSPIEGRDGERLFEKSAPKSKATSHIVCRDCGSVIPLDDPCLPVRESPAINAKGFAPEKISLRIEASCNEMAETGSCSQCESKRGA
ncbi:MAG: transcriptional repressor [Verrucomicrobiota bacterium]